MNSGLAETDYIAGPQIPLFFEPSTSILISGRLNRSSWAFGSWNRSSPGYGLFEKRFLF
jgi:hypothetical protein